MRIEAARITGQRIVLKLAGIETIDDAETWRSAQVFIPKSWAVPLEEDEYYYHQLLGLEVVTTTGEALGRIIEIFPTGANDVYETPLALIPATKDMIREIDLERGRMVVDARPGLEKARNGRLTPSLDALRYGMSIRERSRDMTGAGEDDYGIRLEKLIVSILTDQWIRTGGLSRMVPGEPSECKTDPYISLHIAANCLHYGQECFEGLKAFRTRDGKVGMFRPEAERPANAPSADRICMEAPSEELFLEACRQAVPLNMEFVPPYGTGASLYVRPLLIGTEATVGIKASVTYTFIVLVTPVGPYYKNGFSRSKRWSSKATIAPRRTAPAVRKSPATTPPA